MTFISPLPSLGVYLSIYPQGDVVVPIAKGQPRQLVALGLYVGVEYRVLGIAVRDDDVMR